MLRSSPMQPVPDDTPTIRTEVVIIGAGPAGLAVAAGLQRIGIRYELLEKSEQVGSVWYHHYERLHLHTPKAFSALPYLPFPSAYPRYPSRTQVIAYLEMYARHFGMQPRFGQYVVAVEHQVGGWQVRTQDTSYVAHTVVVATGYNREPLMPVWPGQELFVGEIIHSSAYQNGARYKDQPVLVVGFGNSGGEIAIDLCEHGAQPTIAVRSPINVLPRDPLGIPSTVVSMLLAGLPPKFADFIAAPIVRLTTGDITRIGLHQASQGPLTQIRRQARIPVIDVGTLGLIRAGRIRIRPGIDHFTEQDIVFTDGTAQRYAAVILATGYRSALAAFLPAGANLPKLSGGTPGDRHIGGDDGLYFCGFYVSSTGMLREIAREAKQIAREIGQRVKTVA